MKRLVCYADGLEIIFDLTSDEFSCWLQQGRLKFCAAPPNSVFKSRYNTECLGFVIDSDNKAYAIIYKAP